MREHIRKLHNGRRDVIKSGKFTRYLSQDEQQTQGKVPKDLVVTCVKRRSHFNRIQKNTRKPNHGLNAFFMCNMCTKKIKNEMKSMKSQIRKDSLNNIN